MLFNNNPRWSHLQTKQLYGEEAGFFLAVQKGSSHHPVCGEHQVGLPGPLWGPVGISDSDFRWLSHIWVRNYK